MQKQKSRQIKDKKATSSIKKNKNIKKTNYKSRNTTPHKNYFDRAKTATK